MYDLVAQIYGYVLGVWRFRWPGLALAWILAIAGWAYVWTIPEAYKATARLHVDSSSVLRPLLRGLAIQPDVSQRVAMMSRTFLSRPNLEKLIRMSDLDLTVKTELEQERLLDKVKRSIRLAGERNNPSLYSVSFQHENRDTAKRVVQSLITVFIESTLGDSRKDSTGAQAFINQQIAEYELRMSEAEARLADFKQRNVGLLPGETGGYYNRLASAQGQLEQAKLELSELENRREALTKQLKGEEPGAFSGTFSNSTSLSPIDRRIQMLQEQLDRLSINYTELHPEVVQIKQKIAALEAEKQAAYDALKGDDSSAAYASLGASPVYQSMRTMLAETDAKAAELKVRVAEYQSRVKALEDTVDNIPEIEVELQQLDRDYGVIRAQHSALLQRRESALLSEKVEKNADDVKFRVIDPPFVPLKPTEPNKLLLNTLVLAAALGAGVALAFLLSLFKPVFMDPRTLGQSLGLPVLGIVSMIPTPEAARASLRRAIVFASMTVCLLVVFAGVNIGWSVL
ncbi:chain length-determining protein [Pseudomaricurvus alcaniphilus]|uniref:XrtA system polysaccharide chain length determinant n=1 Tax=Pseudomaricurvus alcaniphilus TaxID=1166482 RepID=UPI00140B0215|nr:XrtA system polysaccharide chain length determinant [Pseudomaricurvus alcaniphilus]NHN36736.1 chain length-determining protein [Pseudomaricurvus alcaniphilus]